MKNKKTKADEPLIKSWYLEDELSGIEQAKKEDIQEICKRLNIPFTRETAISIIYGDTQQSPNRILPKWLDEV